jgi:hypothetical protein
VQTSCSLQHVPIDTAREGSLDPALKARLAFAVQKLAEVRALADAPAGAGAGKQDVEMRKPDIDAKLFSRPAKYAERRDAQFKANPNVRAPGCQAVCIGCAWPGSSTAWTHCNCARVALKPVFISSRTPQWSMRQSLCLLNQGTVPLVDAG